MERFKLEADWVCSPGEIIQEFMDERGISLGKLASRLYIDYSACHMLVTGQLPIGVDLALKLERVLGYDAEFWLRLEHNYQKDKLRLIRKSQCISM